MVIIILSCLWPPRPIEVLASGALLSERPRSQFWLYCVLANCVVLGKGSGGSVSPPVLWRQSIDRVEGQALRKQSVALAESNAHVFLHRARDPGSPRR